MAIGQFCRKLSIVGLLLLRIFASIRGIDSEIKKNIQTNLRAAIVGIIRAAIAVTIRAATVRERKLKQSAELPVPQGFRAMIVGIIRAATVRGGMIYILMNLIV